MSEHLSDDDETIIGIGSMYGVGKKREDDEDYPNRKGT